LPQTQNMMVYQFYWLGLKTREIAEVLDCPEGTVKVYLLRARSALAETLGALRND
jgi:DNA-directed RNA polymerase specialized sigma24 family protein